MPAGTGPGGGLTASVVIPTYNRRDLVAATLDSLAATGWQTERVIVVSDGSTDGTDDLVRSRGVALLTTARAGPAGARNAGWRSCDSDVVAFVDDDCVVEAGWLDALLEPFADATVGLVQGRTVPDGPVGANDRTIDIREERGLYESCNIAYRRRALEDAGGFDESFGEIPSAARTAADTGVNSRRHHFGEDTDLAWRVRRAGWRTAFAPAAVVRHHVFPGTFVSSLKEEWRRGNFPYLVRKIPELRPLLPGGKWFLRRQSGAAQLALVGALVATRSWRLGAALTAPYAWWLLRRSRHPAVLARLATRDVVGSAALIAGSIRHRTVVL
jgi:GT2 family glycosyltransferase